ncbi:expressed unknown protein [Seminavis robusta]|uniref:Uncharacterized protein n=1 Tax=Seminavis robusta TaxID=568900 RepID=A0A9N8H7F8_9STRA|nr:expressed unknown protein [Seminavis robusta]|eukprot:Sro128_g061120.1 n/a (646) ;mRNA; r:29278-31215
MYLQPSYPLYLHPSDSTVPTTSDLRGLQLLECVDRVQTLLRQGNNADASNQLDDCSKQDYPSPNIFDLVPHEDILKLLVNPHQLIQDGIMEYAWTFYDMVNSNLNKPDSIKLGDTRHERLGIVLPSIQDHTVREPATNTPYGHTAYMKYMVWKFIKSLGVKNIALAGLYYGDMYSPEEQFLQLLHREEGRRGMEGGFVMCGPSKKDRAKALQLIRECEVPNIFLDTALVPNIRFRRSKTMSENSKATGDDLMGALMAADKALADAGYPMAATTEDGAPMGQVYINFVDLMEFVNVTSEPVRGNGDDPRDYNMQFQENVTKVEQIFDRLKKADSKGVGQRLTGILYEEGKGRADYRDYAKIAQWLRSHFPPQRYTILVHAHGGTGTEHAASLEAVNAGANGVWAGFIPQAAQSGHNSYFLYLDNLITNGNEHVWGTFDLHTGIELAKAIYSLNFLSVQYPKDCPIWGEYVLRTVHTAFKITNELEWRSRTEDMYHWWSHDDKQVLDEMRRELHAVEPRGAYQESSRYRIAPLVSDPLTIGERLGEVGFIKKNGRTIQEAKLHYGRSMQEIMLAIMNAGIRANFDAEEMLSRLAQWVELRDLKEKARQLPQGANATGTSFNREHQRWQQRWSQKWQQVRAFPVPTPK